MKKKTYIVVANSLSNTPILVHKGHVAKVKRPFDVFKIADLLDLEAIYSERRSRTDKSTK